MKLTEVHLYIVFLFRPKGEQNKSWTNDKQSDDLTTKQNNLQ